MTHTQLKSFLVIARYRSFTAAADQLYISQSALSQQMKSLEQELGFTLFDRGSRQLALTEAGRSFYRNAQQLQALYAHALSEGQQLQQLSSCHIKHFCIGCLGDQFFQLWGDLFRIAMPSAEQYASRSVRYESKEALYTALLRGGGPDRRPVGKRGYPPHRARLSALCPGSGAMSFCSRSPPGGQ